MKFFLDENVHRGLSSFLTKEGHEVNWSPKGIENGKVFKLATDRESTLLTRDSDFLELPYSSSEHFGIIVLRVDPRDLRAQEEALSLLLEEVREFKNKLFVVEEEGFEEISP